MNWEIIGPYLAPAAILVFTLTFIMRLRKQFRAEAERQHQKKMALNPLLPTNGGRGVAAQPTRILPVETLFNGGDARANPVRWELEIDALGRQMLGQIQSKMVALQTLLLETDRLAQRVEILLERLDTKSCEIIQPRPISAAIVEKVAAEEFPVEKAIVKKTVDENDIVETAAEKIEELHEADSDHALDQSLEGALEGIFSSRLTQISTAESILPLPRWEPDSSDLPRDTHIENSTKSSSTHFPPISPSLSLDTLFTTPHPKKGDAAADSISIATEALRERQKHSAMLANYGYSSREIATKISG